MGRLKFNITLWSRAVEWSVDQSVYEEVRVERFLRPKYQEVRCLTVESWTQGEARLALR